MASTLGNAIQFFREFGLFDVVLPFLLVFSVVFAILEKTRILGEEEGNPKRTLNAMVGFVTAMFSIAANKVVNVITTTLPNIVLLAVFVIMFLMLVGIFFPEGGLKRFSEEWIGATGFFAVALFIGVVFIVLDAIKLDGGQSWLSYAWEYVTVNWGGAVVGSLVFLVLVVLAVWWIVGSTRPTGGGTRTEESPRG